MNQEYTLEPEQLRVLGDHPLWTLIAKAIGQGAVTAAWVVRVSLLLELEKELKAAGHLEAATLVLNKAEAENNRQNAAIKEFERLADAIGNQT